MLVSEAVRRLSVYGVRHIDRVPSVLSSWLRWLWVGPAGYVWCAVVGLLLGVAGVLCVGAVGWGGMMISELLGDPLGTVVALVALAMCALLCVVWRVRTWLERWRARRVLRFMEDLQSEVAFQLGARLASGVSVEVDANHVFGVGEVFEGLQDGEREAGLEGWTMRIEARCGGLHCVTLKISPQEAYLAARLQVGCAGSVHQLPGDEVVDGRVMRSVVWSDEDGVVRGALQDAQGTEDAREVLGGWVDALVEVLRSTDPLLFEAKGAQRASRWGGEALEDEEPVRSAVVESTEHIGSYNARSAERLQRSARWGWLGRGVSVGIGLLPWLSAQWWMEGVQRGVGLWAWLALGCSLAYVMVDLPRSYGAAVVWASDVRVPRVLHREVLRVEGTVMSSKGVSVDLARPFQMVWTRSEDVRGGAWLGVEVIQSTEPSEGGQRRLVFEVPIERSSWWRSLPRLDRRACIVDGATFDEWVLPTLFHYARMHGGMFGAGLGVQAQEVVGRAGFLSS